MAHLVWMVLHDGRSIVAGCEIASRDHIETMLGEPGRTLTLTSGDRVDVVPRSDVRDFVVFSSREQVPSCSAIYQLVQL